VWISAISKAAFDEFSSHFISPLLSLVACVTYMQNIGRAAPLCENFGHDNSTERQPHWRKGGESNWLVVSGPACRARVRAVWMPSEIQAQNGVSRILVSSSEL
jgi:hypothetical protein